MLDHDVDADLDAVSEVGPVIGCRVLTEWTIADESGLALLRAFDLRKGRFTRSDALARSHDVCVRPEVDLVPTARPRSDPRRCEFLAGGREWPTESTFHHELLCFEHADPLRRHGLWLTT